MGHHEQSWRARVEELECITKRMAPSALEKARYVDRPARCGFWCALGKTALCVVIFGGIGVMLALGV